MRKIDIEGFGPLLHGTARAWRLKLDQRLKPLGLSQARWRTLLHLSLADRPITQAEVAARLGIEEPTLVTLLHGLERGGWVSRKSAAHDRRCKTVHLGKRAQRVISHINEAATNCGTNYWLTFPRPT
jgi:MarR family transcriptional regulator for hemolysin